MYRWIVLAMSTFLRSHMWIVMTMRKNLGYHRWNIDIDVSFSFVSKLENGFVPIKK